MKDYQKPVAIYVALENEEITSNSSTPGMSGGTIESPFN